MKTGGAWHLRRDQYHTTRLAWLKGAQYVDVTGFYGDNLTIKLSDVEGITDLTPEVIAAIRHDEQADQSDDSLAGSV